MQRITFKKDKIVVSFWDSDSDTWQERPISESDLPLPWFLQYETFVDEDVTIREILTQLKPHAQYLNIIFLSYLKGILFQDILDKVSKVNQTRVGIDINAVCLVWSTELSQIEGDDLPSIQTYPNLLGLQLDDSDDGEDDTFYSVQDMTPAQILDKSLWIDDTFELYKDDDSDDLIFEGITNWSLFDFLRTLIGELTTYIIVVEILNRAEFKVSSEPITSTDLFSQMSDLDKFFNIGQNVNIKRR